MRTLIFIAGAAIAAMAIILFKQIGDPLRDEERFSLLQGGLTLGGGLVICGLFSIRSKWHGITGAGILAFLGLMRTLPSLWKLGAGTDVARFEAVVAAVCLVLVIAAVRTLLAERRRIAIERLQAGEDPRRP